MVWNTSTPKEYCIGYDTIPPQSLQHNTDAEIIMKNLKADNILLETSGKCKISDFYASRRTDDVNTAAPYTPITGTVYWMAPEVIKPQKQRYSSKVDIWSVGCIVFEMWTGVRPWNGQEAMDVLLQV